MQAPERTLRPTSIRPGDRRPHRSHGPSRDPVPGPVTPAIAAYLGLPGDHIRSRLRSGLTLAQIATAEGKSAGGLEEAVVADARTHLDAAVAAGKLTVAQEAALLAGIHAHVAAALDAPLRRP